MSNLRLPAGPWPLWQYRTAEEIHRASDLLGKLRAERLAPEEAVELWGLLTSAPKHNPPEPGQTA